MPGREVRAVGPAAAEPGPAGAAAALAAARALIDRPDMDAEAIAKRSLEIAADICVYTNRNIIIEKLS